MAEGSAPPNVRRRSLPVVVPEACTSCGACCTSNDPAWIRVFDVDAARMDAPALSLTMLRGDERFMRFDDGRCAALNGTLCGIYAMRPDACRWLERGSSTCREILAR